MQKLRHYECVFVARQDVTSAQVETMTKHYTSIIKEKEGQVGKIEFCGLRNLAYPVKKNKKGHYVLMNITASNDAVMEVERQMKLSEDILRYMTVGVEALDDNPSSLMQQRSFRDEKAKNSFAEELLEDAQSNTRASNASAEQEGR